jgi:hypothetical protein
MRAVKHGRFPDGTEKISVSAGDESWGSASVSVGEDQTQDFHGEVAQNEDDVLQVCRTLRSELNVQGGRWSRFRSAPGETSDVDAIADDESGGPPMHVQVTRVERGAWAILAREKKPRLHLTKAELADGIRSAVELKTGKYPPAQRAQLVLALDACRSPAYAMAEVVEIFRLAHQEWLDELGYRAVWLVGPTGALTTQLDGRA